MATLLDWNSLIHKVQHYRKIYPDAENDAQAFSFLALEYILNLVPEDAKDAITDGGNDRGVDAVYVDENTNTIHIFQFKFVQSFEKAKNNFPGGEIDKLLSFFADLLSENKSLKNSCNPLLWNKVQEIWAALDKPKPSFIVHFCGDMEPLIKTEQNRVESALENYRSFSVKYHTLESLVSLFLEKKEPKIDATIKIVDKDYFERSDGNIRGLIATMDALELIDLIRDKSNPDKVNLALFNDNVRVYLSKSNRINKKIIETAISETNAEFWYLNNGITITCESFDYPKGRRAPTVHLKNVQIVNGGQTSNCLFEAYKIDPEHLSNVLVLVRIYETKSDVISNKIAESTNSQTPIGGRDLRSNDEIQKKLEEGFKDLGYFYERKGRQHATQTTEKRIDALEAGQAYLAYYMELPEVGFKDRGRVFGDLFEAIFNEDITPTKLLVSFKLQRKVDAIKRLLQKQIKNKEEFDTNHLFLVYGVYHVLYVVHLLCVQKGIELSDEELASSLIPEAINIVSKVVRGKMQEDEAFNTSNFFKDSKTKILIAATMVV